MTSVFFPVCRKSILSPDIFLPGTEYLLKFIDRPGCIIRLHERPYFAQSFVASFVFYLPGLACILHSDAHQFF